MKWRITVLEWANYINRGKLFIIWLCIYISFLSFDIRARRYATEKEASAADCGTEYVLCFFILSLLSFLYFTGVIMSLVLVLVLRYMQGRWPLLALDNVQNTQCTSWLPCHSSGLSTARKIPFWTEMPVILNGSRVILVLVSQWRNHLSRLGLGKFLAGRLLSNYVLFPLSPCGSQKYFRRVHVWSIIEGCGPRLTQ